MRNSATQNPANKVGRNSGAGPDGISRVRLTEREEQRGLATTSVQGRSWGRIGAGVGAVLLGAGAALFAVQRRRQQQRSGIRKVVDRVTDWI